MFRGPDYLSSASGRSVQVGVSTLVDLAICRNKVPLPGLQLVRALPAAVAVGASRAAGVRGKSGDAAVLSHCTAPTALSRLEPRCCSVLSRGTKETVVLGLGAAQIVISPSRAARSTRARREPFRDAVLAPRTELTLNIVKA